MVGYLGKMILFEGQNLRKYEHEQEDMQISNSAATDDVFFYG